MLRMFIIFTVSLLLAILPIVIAFFFKVVTLPRKLMVIQQDVSKLTGTGDGNLPAVPTSPRHKFYTGADIKGLADRYFATSTLTIPSVLLTALYVAGFLLCVSYLRFHYVDNSTTWFFPPRFVDAVLPILYAFIGVYLFNLGTMVRRLYLADINEQVFWGAVNRLLLSLGLALVIMKSGVGEQPWLYFSIGFLANIILDWVLEKTLKLLDIGQPKQVDLPLQMVRGITIWKEYRLEEESIENVQNLATADVVDLAVRTHYNARTLIDWIDQAIVLARLTDDQVKAMTSQAMALSAIELAQAAPENNNGDRTFSDGLASQLKVDPVLMAATLDRLYEDEYVRNLWDLWQSGKESATSGRVRIPLPTPKPKVDAKPEAAPVAAEPGKAEN